MHLIKRVWKWGCFFLTAIVFAISVQWIRQGPPLASNAGWRYQVVETLDQAGDWFHAIEELPKAMVEEDSRKYAEQFTRDLEIRNSRIPLDLASIDAELMYIEYPHKIPRLIFQKGVIAELQHQPEEALDWYGQALEKKSGLFMAWVRRALIWERLGNTMQAEEEFKKALDIAPDGTLGRFHYGLFLARSTTQFDEARKQAEFLKAIRPIYSQIIIQTIEEHAMDCGAACKFDFSS
ncbi:MAG: hypothetical protein HQM12_16980 [SAR324 cluster bacterium]|nr:hypothetical protein [SAR324 cluster bacterium]